MFQIKDFNSIAASMINYATSTQDRITDFTIGSVMRTVIEAPAVEIEELYQQMWLGLKEGIPVALYQAFGFERLQPTSGQGMITLTITAGAAFTIPANTAFIANDLDATFKSVNEVTIALNQTSAEVLVTDTLVGLGKVIPDGTPFTANVVRLVSAIAQPNFTFGSGEESSELRKQRFTSYVMNLARSTIAGLEYALSTVKLVDGNGIVIEQVKQASVVEWFLIDPLAPIGVVNCYLYNGVNGASPELIAEANKILYGYTNINGAKIAGYKAAGVRVVVESATNIAINISAVVELLPDSDRSVVLALVSDAITAYIDSVAIGNPIILAEIIAAVMSVPNVFNFTITSPADDIVIDRNRKAVKGVYAFT